MIYTIDRYLKTEPCPVCGNELIRKAGEILLIILFFITPFVFFLLRGTFHIFISNKLPKWLPVYIGRLNTNDIRGLNDDQLNYLRNQVVANFTLSVGVTFLISLAFVILGFANDWQMAIICNAIGLAIGLPLTLLSTTRNANKVKAELNK